MIQSSQFTSRSFLRIENRSYQAIPRFRKRFSSKTIFDDPYGHAARWVLRMFQPVATIGINVAEIGPVLEALHTSKLHAPFTAPQQIRSRCRRPLPQRPAGEQPVRQAQQPSLQLRNHLLGQMQLTASTTPQLRSKQHVRPILQQSHKAQLRVSAGAARRRRPPECPRVFFTVSNIHRAAVQTDHAPVPVPGSLRMSFPNRSHHFIVDGLHHFPAQPLPRLRNARFPGYLVSLLAPQQPVPSAQRATQHFPATGSHPKSQPHDVIDHQMRRQLPLPLARPTRPLENFFHLGCRIPLSQDSHRQFVRDSLPIRQVSGLTQHKSPSSCPHSKPNHPLLPLSCKVHLPLSEPYCGFPQTSQYSRWWFLSLGNALIPGK